MAELCVSYFLKKLANLLIQEAAVLKDIRDRIESIDGELKQIQKFLKDAEAKQGDERVRKWWGYVRDITDYVEDVIDTFIFKVAPHEISLQSRKKSTCTAFFKEWIARYKVDKAHQNFGEETTQIITKIHQIYEKASTCGIAASDGLVEAKIASLRWRDCIPTSYDEEQDFVGFEEDLRTLLVRLGDPNTQQSVVSIVGMGGSGKTTLAKKIYINDVVKFQFNFRVWVSVSKKYTGIQLLAKIARQMLGFQVGICEKMSRKELEVKLYEFLKEKRYLVVLDDVWENEVWDEVKEALPCGINGSRILITTRNKDVAFYFDPNSLPHELRLLNCKESLELLYKKVSKTDDHRSSLELAELEKVVERCDGLPIALVEIGGLLLMKEKSPTAQLRVLESENLHQLCLRILAMSYHHLPTHLKWCFLYCCIFPDHYEIPARKLLMLWVAEGFIHPIDGRTQEEVAEEYLEQLNSRTLIQAVKRRSDGRIQICRVHRLLREFAVSEAKSTNFLHVLGTGTNFESPFFGPLSKSRRIGMHSSTEERIPQLKSTPHLRTVFLLSSSKDCKIEYRNLKYFARRLKLINVLVIEGVQLLNVPDVIVKFIHLRYLGLKQTGLRGIPSFLGNLYNLQALDVSCNSIRELPLVICNLFRLQTLDIRRNLITSIPGEISEMEELRHLYMDKEVASGELQIDRLRNIQTLSVVHAGNWIEEAFGKLRNLRKMGIYGGFHVDFNVDIWELISDLDHLRSLELVVSKWIPVPTKLPFRHMLSLHKLHLSGQLTRPLNVQDFPPNLSHLSLSWSYLEQGPIAELEKVPNLRILELQMQAYVGKRIVFSGKGFPQLEFLRLKCLNELQECKVEKGAMPVLTRLCFSRCAQLKRLPEGLQYLTTLQKLELLWMLPTFQARLRQYQGDDWFKIQNIPSVVISGTPITGSEN